MDVSRYDCDEAVKNKYGEFMLYVECLGIVRSLEAELAEVKTENERLKKKLDRASGLLIAHGQIVSYEKSNTPDTISDGFGSTWSAYCAECGQKTMQVVRPGKSQCSRCG